MDKTNVTETALPGVRLLKPEVFEDHRGDYVMVWNKKQFQGMGLPEFVEQDISTSSKGVLRGIHTDYECDKLIQVLHGKIYYVVVACKKGDPHYGQWEAFILSGENHHQIYKPRQYGAGFLSLTDDTVFYYSQTGYYEPKRQETFAWNDKRFGIFWPVEYPILSRRDVEGHYVK